MNGNDLNCYLSVIWKSCKLKQDLKIQFITKMVTLQVNKLNVVVSKIDVRDKDLAWGY